MRKALWISFLGSVLLILGLVACTGNEQQESIKEQDQGTVKEHDHTDRNQNEEVTENDRVQSQEENKEQYENKSFMDVTVDDAGNQFVVTGKARVFEGVFQYAVVSEGKIVKEDNYQTEGAPAWGDFELEIPKDILKGEKSYFELFVYSAKDGSKVDILQIPLK